MCPNVSKCTVTKGSSSGLPAASNVASGDQAILSTDPGVERGRVQHEHNALRSHRRFKLFQFPPHTVSSRTHCLPDISRQGRSAIGLSCCILDLICATPESHFNFFKYTSEKLIAGMVCYLSLVIIYYLSINLHPAASCLRTSAEGE